MPMIPAWVAYVLIAAAMVYSYTAAQQAKKAAQRALGRSSTQEKRGLLYQSRASSQPRRLVYGRTRIGGLEVYLGSSGNDNEYFHYILYWCEGPVVGVEKIFFDDEEVIFDLSGNAVGKYAGHVKIVNRRGVTGQAVISEAVAELPGWTTTDIGVNCCYSWIRVKFSESLFPNGMPSISSVIQGRDDVIDYRVPIAAYSNNAALCLAHYLSLERIGPDISPYYELDQTTLNAAANVCDENVSLSTGGAEKRYTFDGIIQLDEEPESIIESFRTAMAGTAVYSGGRWRIYAGVYITPTFELTEDMIVGPVNLKTKVSKSDKYNTAKGVYSSELFKWQPTDFVAYVDTTALADDKEELVTDIELINTNSPTRCRRIAKIDTKRSRLSRTITADFNVEALRVQPGLPVLFTFARYGFNQLPMDVLEYGMSIQENQIRVRLTLRETSSDVYAWITAEDKASEVVAGGEPSIQDPNQVSPVLVDPSGGSYSADVTVSLACATIGATIKYQIVAYQADEGVAWTTYTAPFYVPKDLSGASLWVYATKATLTDSAHARYDYEFYDEV